MEPTIITEGPKAAELNAEKDKQIAGLVAQVKAEQEAREMEKKQASLAAANFDGVLYGAEHVDPGLPRNAIEEEAKLGKARLPDPDPQEVIKAKDRVIAILKNEVEKAKILYGQAFDEAKQAKAELAEKDKELAKRQTELDKRATDIVRLEREKMEEQIKHKKDVEDAIAKLRKQYEDRQMALFIAGLRFVGLGAIVAGAALIIWLRMPLEGAGSIGFGLLCGVASIWLNWLFSQAWFYWAVGVVVLLVLVGIGYGIYRLWKKGKLHEKVTAAIQDVRDEAVIKGTDMWDKLEEHLKYRLGPKDSSWGKAQLEETAKLGLIDVKGEELQKVEKQPIKPDN